MSNQDARWVGNVSRWCWLPLHNVENVHSFLHDCSCKSVVKYLKKMQGGCCEKKLKSCVLTYRNNNYSERQGVSRSFILLQLLILAHTYVANSRGQELLEAKLVMDGARRGIGFNVVHVQAPRSPLKLMQAEDEPAGRTDILRYAQMFRRQKSTAALKGSTVTLDQTSGEYYMTAKLGTAAQEVILIIDTGSEITWVQCAPCNGCAPILDPVYDSARSSSYKVETCDSPLCANSSEGTYAFCEGLSNTCTFATYYADGSFSYGNISLDVLTMKSAEGNPVIIRNFLFGCAELDYESVPTGASGLLGLDFGRMGLSMQLGQQYAWKFSYCFPDKVWNLNSSGIIFFGDAELPQELQYSPIILNNSQFTPFYYIALKGISINNELLQVPKSAFELDSAGRGGTFIDSGTSFTNLVHPVYNELRKAFLKNLPRSLKLQQGFSFAGLDTCFNISRDAFQWITLPTLAMHFEGGAKIQLPAVSLLLPAAGDQDQLTVCLAFQDAGSAENGATNVIGNYQQQNLWIEYDILNSRVGFAQAHCATD